MLATRRAPPEGEFRETVRGDPPALHVISPADVANSHHVLLRRQHSHRRRMPRCRHAHPRPRLCPRHLHLGRSTLQMPVPPENRHCTCLGPRPRHLLGPYLLKSQPIRNTPVRFVKHAANGLGEADLRPTCQGVRSVRKTGLDTSTHYERSHLQPETTGKSSRLIFRFSRAWVSRARYTQAVRAPRYIPNPSFKDSRHEH